MNEISQKRIKLARKNFKRFKNPNLVAAIVTGSVAKGYADDNSDIDTLIFYKRPYTSTEYDRILAEARESGGDLHYDVPGKGFAVYYYIDGIKCDFGFGDYKEAEKLIDDMLRKPEIDLMKHLQISGFIESVVLYGKKWAEKYKKKAAGYDNELAYIMVRYNLKFEPEWVMKKMAIERGDELYLREYLIIAIDKIMWVLCGLNKMYHPGKLKGIEHRINKMKIKPDNLMKRCKKVINGKNVEAIEQLYKLIRDTVDLVDRYKPDVSTKRVRKVLEMKLRR
jgi:predicted nucleotidyltransferase